MNRLFVCTSIIFISSVFHGCSEDDAAGDGYVSEDLMAHYALDGDANDSSGHGSHGVVQGPLPTNDRHGEAATAMTFNGSTDYIVVNDTANFQFSDSLTIAAWVRTDSLRTQVIFRKGGGLVIPKFELYLAGNGDRGFRLGTLAAFYSGGYPLQTWMHIAGTYDGQSMILYINGSPGDTVQAEGALTTDKNSLLIGTRTGTSADTFSGSMDDVRIYRRALTAAEIASLAQP